MKKVCFMLLLAFTGCSNGNLSDEEPTEVYICTGKYSHSYHRSKSCNGLNNCSGEIKKISIEEAKKEYDKCQICY